MIGCQRERLATACQVMHKFCSHPFDPVAVISFFLAVIENSHIKLSERAIGLLLQVCFLDYSPPCSIYSVHSLANYVTKTSAFKQRHQDKLTVLDHGEREGTEIKIALNSV